jgi:extracellular elastinolytic metalloproteinase
VGAVGPLKRGPGLGRNATHLRFEVVTNQCTGGPDYAGEQDADPRASTDCTTNSAQARIVRAAEFQAFAD